MRVLFLELFFVFVLEENILSAVTYVLRIYPAIDIDVQNVVLELFFKNDTCAASTFCDIYN